MPFKSKQQQKLMFSQHPKIARKWADEQIEQKGRGSFKKMPKRVKGSKSTPAKTRAAARKYVQSSRKKGGK